jgi:membrane fusion protein (multidrug efflux system)
MKLSRTTLIKIAFSIIGIIAIGGGIEYYFHYASLHPKTNDAYLKAHFLKVSSLFAGQVESVNIHNNQVVKKGQLLFSLNQKPFELEKQATAAQLEIAKQKLASEQASILSAQQELKKAKIAVAEAKQNMELTKELVADGYAPALDNKINAAKYNAALAGYKAAQYKILGAKRALGNIKNNNIIKAEQAAYEAAVFKLKHSRYFAPNDGIVANLSLRPGQIIGAGEPLFVLVDNHTFWVTANFAENKLQRIKIGQPATIKIDMYPNITLNGKILEINNSSGSSFSLLPTQNASGNWVKVTQRFSVKISIDSMPHSIMPRIGASCTVQVNTTHG